jgi:hypothetical protein
VAEAAEWSYVMFLLLGAVMAAEAVVMALLLVTASGGVATEAPGRLSATP